MRESLGFYEPQRRIEREGGPRWSLSCDPAGLNPCGRNSGPSRPDSFGEAELERTCWDPKDGELCLSRLKPEETLVEDRSDSDVQIDRRSWV